MKYFYIALVFMLFACGNSSSNGQAVGHDLPSGSCELVEDCDCPTGYDASCDDGQCLCLRTEVIESDAGATDSGTSDTGTTDSGTSDAGICQADENCDCPTGYDASCEDGICFCKEVTQECYIMKRHEFMHRLMSQYINLDAFVPPTTPTFGDVPASHEHYKAIEAAFANEILSNPDGDFRPDDMLNRAEVAKIFAGLFGILDGFVSPTTPSYLDVTDSNWFYNSVESITAVGYMKGYVDQNGEATGYFGPGDNASSCLVDKLMSFLKAKADSSKIQIVIDEVSWWNQIQIEGQTELLMTRYRVFGTSVDNPLNSLKVQNQPGGVGMPIVPTSALRLVFVSCSDPSGSGGYSYHTGTLDANGELQFSNLNCYDESGEGVRLQLGYDVARIADVGESLSGQVFRLVLDDDRVIGVTLNSPTRTVRKSSPSFSNGTGPTNLANGARELYEVNISAHPNGRIGLARIGFDITPMDGSPGGQLELSEYKLYRDGMLMDNVSFTVLGSMLDFQLVVAFSEEVVIAAGMTARFSLEATVSGTASGDQIRCMLTTSDENMEVTGKTANTTPNTAKLVSLALGAGLFGYSSDLEGMMSSSRSIIWSDYSANTHVFSTQDDASSYDWTNGFRLDAELLSPVTLEN